jgi:hypothetical protein
VYPDPAAVMWRVRSFKICQTIALPLAYELLGAA